LLRLILGLRSPTHQKKPGNEYNPPPGASAAAHIVDSLNRAVLTGGRSLWTYSAYFEFTGLVFEYFCLWARFNFHRAFFFPSIFSRPSCFGSTPWRRRFIRALTVC
jgi:hypothetical protein